MPAVWPTVAHIGQRSGDGRIASLLVGHRPDDFAQPSVVLRPHPVEQTDRHRQRTACFTSAVIRASTSVVSSITAKETGQNGPSSRLASAWNSNVEYRTLNLDLGLKKQMTLPFLPSVAQAGMP